MAGRGFVDFGLPYSRFHRLRQVLFMVKMPETDVGARIYGRFTGLKKILPGNILPALR